MDRYTLTYEGKARFRRMEARIHSDTSAMTKDYEVLHHLYESGAATVEEIENYTGMSWNELENRLSGLMYHGYIEGLAE